MTMRPYLQFLLSLGAAATLATSVACIKRPYTPRVEPTPPTSSYTKSAPASPVSVEAIKRYRDGKVLNLNRLRVDWRANDKCSAINPKYGNTTENLVFDNMMRVLDRYPTDGIFQDGFDFIISEDIFTLDRNIRFPPVHFWSLGRPYTREGTENPETLEMLGRELYDSACNDPEQKASDAK